jgi:hypothetical protein
MVEKMRLECAAKVAKEQTRNRQSQETRRLLLDKMALLKTGFSVDACVGFLSDCESLLMTLPE